MGPECYGSIVSPDLRTAIERMNREERLQLLDDVWALVRDDSLAVPTSHADELRARLAQAEADGLPGDLWEDVRERVRGRV
jgi:putative addiction module component (TIGR02574 family)